MKSLPRKIIMNEMRGCYKNHVKSVLVEGNDRIEEGTVLLSPSASLTADDTESEMRCVLGTMIIPKNQEVS